MGTSAPKRVILTPLKLDDVRDTLLTLRRSMLMDVSWVETHDKDEIPPVMRSYLEHHRRSTLMVVRDIEKTLGLESPKQKKKKLLLRMRRK